MGSFSAMEVPARQSLNAEDALYKAASRGIDWLLHLDLDEVSLSSTYVGKQEHQVIHSESDGPPACAGST